MTDSSRSSWYLFAGGIVLGSAAAAGAAYAITAYYISKEQQQAALRIQELLAVQPQAGCAVQQRDAGLPGIL
jgi:hypothetical protein